MVFIKKQNMILTLAKSAFKDKSLPRTLMDLAIKNYTEKNPLKGKVIDLGSKTDKVSYNDFAKKDRNCHITYTDLRPASENVEKIDLEKKFEIKNEVYDMVLCFNTLEHIYDYKNVASESHRILVPNGIFIGSTPFLIPYHPDPNDYFRYTSAAIRKFFSDTGFEEILIQPLGVGPFSTGLYYIIMHAPRILRPILLTTVLLLDKFLNLITNNRHTGESYAASYFFVFKKK
ncbi:hypothetical protein A2344_03710 [Candidatus Peregrinibacteria bacterium RIFOXYB12_FULL_41_12]|nr:MAG: hypothetical protein A2244_05050 [Candidatus Peregrinibacteria bacterium RIFOXYA2_FULL_41_18]OGJ49763.1 MAG: hypothetical protein A2344_03710 [Candidatus Peregrinibacteria bacterium RIFOXYB12_FULL_41_12]OGJ54019.1 MAG: hypothetical protein A2336_05400 [Candidatus Peregrinibacteria bacterium RIFOXYB2_FULL_41_88]